MKHPKRKGRACEYDKPMPRKQVRLDDETVELGRLLGNRNLSKGLRRAVRIASQKQRVKDVTTENQS